MEVSVVQTTLIRKSFQLLLSFSNFVTSVHYQIVLLLLFPIPVLHLCFGLLLLCPSSLLKRLEMYV